jgi:hypothetical protein
MVQTQRPEIVILDQLVHGRHRIALVELTCPWETDAMGAEERKTVMNAHLKTALSNEGWDCSLYLIEVGARGHILFGRYSGFWSRRPEVKYWANDERRQQDFSCVFVFHIPGAQ